MMKILNHTGDTIVEVLIAIAIVSVVLGGAYVSANNSLTGTRQAQERGESLKLAEEQIERLSEAKINPAVFTQTNFCINNTLQLKPDTDPACQQAPQGGVVYKTSIARTGNTFTINNSWERAGGGGNEQLSLIYRLYAP